MKKTLIILMALVILVGCTPASQTPADDGVSVVTSFYPIYVFAANVVGDTEGVTLSCLTGNDVGCLHDYSITPEDMMLMEKADLFIINGAGMEPFADNVPAGTQVVDSSEGIELLSEHGEQNPHIWLSVQNAVKQVENITEGLCRVDADNAQLYRKNAEEYIKKLEGIDCEIKECTKNLTQRNIVTFHEAFPYFARDYGFNIVASLYTDGESEPGAAQLAEIIEKVKAEDVAAVFTEPQYSPKTAELIAEETGVPVYSLDPAVTGEMTAEGYEAAMKKNIETIKNNLK